MVIWLGRLMIKVNFVGSLLFVILLFVKVILIYVYMYVDIICKKKGELYLVYIYIYQVDFLNLYWFDMQGEFIIVF